MISVLLIDDHKIVLDGLRGMLDSDDRISATTIAQGGAQALEFISQKMPDVVITDISMPCMSGIELTRKITERFPSVRVIILSMYITPDYIHNAIGAGAKGYLSKEETTKNELIGAILSVMQGKEYYSPSITQSIFNSYLSMAKAHPESDPKPIAMLTLREQEILRLFVEGLSNQEIAKQLSISVRTVETHKSNMMQKLNFKSTVELVKFAIRNGLADA